MQRKSRLLKCESLQQTDVKKTSRKPMGPFSWPLKTTLTSSEWSIVLLDVFHQKGLQDICECLSKCSLLITSDTLGSLQSGEFKAMRDATLWNGFQASPEGQEVYQTRKLWVRYTVMSTCLIYLFLQCNTSHIDGGIKGDAHSVLSDLWHAKTPDEKLNYRQYTRKSNNLTSVLLAGADGIDLNQTKGYSADFIDEPISTGDNGWVGSGRSLANARSEATGSKTEARTTYG